MSFQNWPWSMIGALIAAAVLAISGWSQIIRPVLRRKILERPVKAYFHIREFNHSDLGYALQNDQGHNVKELVVPSNSLVEVEVSYYPRINFKAEETVFGFEGDPASKPIIESAIAPFVARGEIANSVGYWDRKESYHYRSPNSGRAIGSCYTKGFKLRTRKAGVYKAWLGFLTDEIDGSGKLVLRVEDKPVTKMKCSAHWLCFIKPSRANSS